MSYYNKLVDDAISTISEHGDFNWFVSEDPYIGPKFTDHGRPIYYPEDDKPPFDLN